MSKGTLNSKDKNNLIMAGVLVFLIALIAVFFNVSRAVPFVYMIMAIEAFEILYVIPNICGNFYKIYGMDCGATKFIPYYNIIAIFNKVFAILSVIALVVVAVLWYLAVGPMFWVTIKNFSFFTDVQYSALGWAILATIVWSFIVGIGYLQIIKSVNSMKEEFFNGVTSKAEVANYVLVLFPIIRCYALFNLLHNMKLLISYGYEYGKDYNELKLEEEE